MPVSNIFRYKLYSDKLTANSSKKISGISCWSFWLCTICIILNLNNRSFAEGLAMPEENNENSIADILNKVAGEKAPEIKNNPSNNSLSKIVSSLVKKNNEPSLMFSDEEIVKIDQALDAHKNEKPFDALVKEEEQEKTQENATDKTDAHLYLESILYKSPNNWSAWINGKKISSTNNSKNNDLYIKSISADNANIVWTMSISKWKILSNQTSENAAPLNADNHVELNFNLSFNQTYILASGKIIEGKIALEPTTAVEPLENEEKAH